MLLVSAALLAAASSVSIAEASHALGAGRLDQARAMVVAAVSAGASGDPVDRLVADLAFARGENQQALGLYEALLARHPTETLLAERAGISAMRLGNLNRAVPLLDRATALDGASWRAWNARGAAADLACDWTGADAAYAHALALAPDRAEVANNRGWSLLLRGRWQDAEAELARGAALDPSLPRLADNLQLARAALARELPARLPGEAEVQWAARLNDAGVAAAVRGDRPRAVAAFARAIAARPAWDQRTAANLAAVGGTP